MGKSNKKKATNEAAARCPAPSSIQDVVPAASKKSKRSSVEESLVKPLKKQKVTEDDVSLKEKKKPVAKQGLPPESRKGKPESIKPAPVKSKQPAAAKIVKDAPSEEEGSDSDEEEEKPPVKPGKQAKPQAAKGAMVKNGKKSAQPEGSSGEESSDSEEDEPVKKPVAKAQSAKDAGQESSSSEEESLESNESSDENETKIKKSEPPVGKQETSSSEEELSDSEAEKPPAKAQKAPTQKGKKAPPAKKVDTRNEESSEESSEGDSEDELAKPIAVTGKAAEPEAEEESSTEEEESSEEESDSDEDKMPQMKKAKVEHAKPAAKGGEGKAWDNKSAKTDQQSTTPSKGSAGGSKTVFMKNLSWSIDEDSIREFFQDIGDVHEVRLAINADGEFRGFGHVDFTTEEGAQKACKKSGENLAGREVFIDLARERARDSDFKSPRPASGGTTAYVRGFDKYQDEDTIRSSLSEFFSECGVANIRIPTDRETGTVKGFAYIDFQGTDSLSKAIEYNGSDLNGRSLLVEEASGGPPGGSGGRGRGRGGDFGGGRRGRGSDFGGGRGGRGRGGSWDKGRGGRGRGGGGFGGSKERANFSGSGKKTTFDQE